jgi:hypothetical protein
VNCSERRFSIFSNSVFEKRLLEAVVLSNAFSGDGRPINGWFQGNAKFAPRNMDLCFASISWGVGLKVEILYAKCPSLSRSWGRRGCVRHVCP